MTIFELRYSVINKRTYYKLKVKRYLIEIRALGFDPGIELTTMDSF
jgi:hypothetical protein